LEDYNRPWSFAVKEGDKELLERLNQGLIIVKATGQYDEIYKKWFGTLEPGGISSENVLKYVGGTVLLFSLIGAILLLWSFSLRKQVALRTRSLEMEIKERKLVEKSLRESEERFRKIFENNHAVMLVIDPVSGKVMDANPAACNYYGYPHDQFVKDLHIFDINMLTEDEIKKEMELAAEGKRTYFNFRHKLANGDIKDVEVYSGKISIDNKELLLSIVHDVTQRKLSQKALRESEEKYRIIVETTNEGVWMLDASSKTSYVNSRMAQMFGYSPEEMIGKDLFDFMDPDVRIDAQKYLQRRKQGLKEDHDFKFTRKDGTSLWAIVSTNPVFDVKGQYAGALGMVTDISGRKRSEEELKITLEKLKNSNEELKHFAYIASHDLQEPLRMISSYLQLIERRYKGKLDKDADEFIAFAVDGANRLQDMITGLLAYSRVETQGKSFEKVDFSEVLRIAILNLKVAIQESDALITNDPLPIVEADGGQFVQVFQNLIANSIKFRSEKQPHIHICAKLISEIEGSKIPDAWQFLVKDNGIGIETQHKERLFNIFQRLHRSEYSGVGIGLSVCKRIIQRHGGNIWFESEFGKGSTFYFTIPIKEAKNEK
jgi:PAS domain S-box-containing protein